MKIVRIKSICPKCKKEYINQHLAGFYSDFASVAKEFVENNVIKTHCDECGVKVVEERFLKLFNQSGEYEPKMEIYNPTDNEVEFDLYLKILREINNFFYCVQDGKIEIISKMDKEEKGVKTYILLKGKCNDKEYDLLKINVLEYEYSIGDRKNRFDLKGFEAHIDMVASIIYEYLFEDDCSPYYNKKNTSNIIYKAM